LGRTTCATCIADLGNGLVYLGSRIADSQLVRMRASRGARSAGSKRAAPRDTHDDDDDDDDDDKTRMAEDAPPDANDDDNDESALELLATYTNIGPIIDMCEWLSWCTRAFRWW
jgi:hypothetical protein